MTDNEMLQFQATVNSALKLCKMTPAKRQKFIETADTEFKDSQPIKDYCQALFDFSQQYGHCG